MKLPLTTVCVLVCAGVAHAKDVKIGFDHAGDAGNLTRNLELEPGDRVKVSVANTCPARFSFESLDLARDPEAGIAWNGALPPACTLDIAKEKLRAAGYCELKTQELSFVHAEDNGGYLIEIRKKASAVDEALGLTPAEFAAAATKLAESGCGAIPADLEPKADPLENRVYHLSLRDSPWAIGMSGGVTISSVVDPRYAVVNDPTSTATPPGTLVVRDKGAEDSQKLGFAGFVHVHHERFKIPKLDIPLAFTFGLGIDDSSSINTMVGFSVAASDLAYITLGWNWSAVDRLPAGQQLDRPPMNDNVLNNLPKRTDDGWFLGVSFKFMSPGEGFFKGKVVPEIEAEDTEGSE